MSRYENDDMTFKNSDIGEIRAAIAAGANVHARDHHGRTPLIHAAMEGDDDRITLLLQAGTDVRIRNVESKTALDIATAAGNEKTAALLRKYEK